jgi:hypothetical protein
MKNKVLRKDTDPGRFKLRSTRMLPRPVLTSFCRRIKKEAEDINYKLYSAVAIELGENPVLKGDPANGVRVPFPAIR